MSDNSAERPFTAVILAAGDGSRMKSARPKVLHEIGGLSMLGHVMHLAKEAGAAEIVIVRSAAGEAVEQEARAQNSDVKIAVQDPPQGTGHAVQCALPELDDSELDVVVLYADTPLLRPKNVTDLLSALEEGHSIAVLGFHPEDPAAYGRLVVGPGNELEAIVEFNDGSDRERAIDYCNSGVMAVKGRTLSSLLSKLTNKNAKKEFYLTDLVGLARGEDLSAMAVEAAADDVLGVNARVELAGAEALFQSRRRQQVMEDGVTLMDPSTTYLSWDTSFGTDCILEPNVFIAPGVTIENNVRIRANSHLEGAVIEDGAEIGPFARIRPEARIGPRAKIGNFVEVKKASIEEGAKVNHLSYIGDARVGAKTNIGAGTITCNYDGFNKYVTDIGSDVFIGSNTALVAPVSVGDGANVAAGSTITEKVPGDALGVARGRQSNKEGWAVTFRAQKAQEKEQKKKG